MSIWSVAFWALTVWCLLITFVGVPTPSIVRDNEETPLFEDPHENEAFSVEEIIALKQGEVRVIAHVMFEEILWRFTPMCIFVALAPDEPDFWWEVMLVFAGAFAFAHTLYTILYRILVHLPLGIVWGAMYLYLLEWYGVPGLVYAFIGVSVWHSIPNLKVFRYRISKLAQL